MWRALLALVIVAGLAGCNEMPLDIRRCIVNCTIVIVNTGTIQKRGENSPQVEGSADLSPI